MNTPWLTQRLFGTRIGAGYGSMDFRVKRPSSRGAANLTAQLSDLGFSGSYHRHQPGQTKKIR